MASYRTLIFGFVLFATIIFESVQGITRHKRAYRYRYTYPASNQRQSKVYYWNPQSTSGENQQRYSRTFWYSYPRNYRRSYGRDYGYQRDYAGANGNTRTQVVRRERQPRHQECGQYSRSIVTINGETCAVAVNRRPSLCYTYETHSMDCCDACMPRKNLRKPDCSYGDKANDCQNLKAHQCYLPHNRNLCCASCPRFQQQGQPNCEYGDKAEWCRTIRPQQCYLNDNTCCETCPRYRTGETSCEYGDRLQGCEAVLNKINICYRPDVERNCCSTCKHVKNTASVGCEYGDRIDYIETHNQQGHPARLSCRDYVHLYGRRQRNSDSYVPDVCMSAPIRDDCCRTCGAYSNRG